MISMRKVVIITSAWIVLQVAYALEVHLTKEYYDIVPTNAGSIQLAMIKASHWPDSKNGHHTVGGYEASATVRRMDVVYENGRCQAKTFEMQLNGTMTLPRLKMGNYSLKIRQAFNDELKLLVEHENEHANIWRVALQNFETKIQGINVIDNARCDQLIHEINQEMSKVLDEVWYRNLEFDCLSYGDRLNLPQCA